MRTYRLTERVFIKKIILEQNILTDVGPLAVDLQDLVLQYPDMIRNDHLACICGRQESIPFKERNSAADSERTLL